MIQNLQKEQNMNNSSVVPAGACPAVFNNPEFGSVRVIMKDDNDPLFCLKDVCDILGLDQVSRVKERLGEDTLITITGINPKNPEQCELTRLQLVPDMQNYNKEWSRRAFSGGLFSIL